MKTFQHDISAPAFRGVQRNRKPLGLHFSHADPEKARHFSRVWSHGQQRRFARTELVRAPRKGIEPIGVENNRNFGITHDAANEFLGLSIGRKARADGEYRFTARELRKSSVLEISQAG